MSVLGKMDPTPKAGAIHRRHIVVEDLTGPSSDVVITNGSTGDITIDIAGEVPRTVEYAGVESIDGIPSDVYIAGISFDKSGKKLTISLYNGSGADVTITANSLTIRVVSIA